MRLILNRKQMMPTRLKSYNMSLLCDEEMMTNLHK